ncbi:MAG: 4Fe-4S binding protein [Clostridiales bacterium]|nr:4Fe-4S binding protein [Clostridiales bacterium]
MSHSINSDCISCGSCADTCPVNAICEGEKRYEIDPSICIDCGACESACPVNAIKED